LKTNKKLASQLTVVAAVAALVGTSAFADSRHHDETRGSSGGRVERQERGGGDRGGHVERGDRGDRGSRDRGERGGERSQQPSEQRSTRNWDRGQSNDNRNFERGSSSRDFNRESSRERESRGNVTENWNRNRGRSENFYRDSNRGLGSVPSSYYRNGHPPYFIADELRLGLCNAQTCHQQQQKATFPPSHASS